MSFNLYLIFSVFLNMRFVCVCCVYVIKKTSNEIGVL